MANSSKDYIDLNPYFRLLNVMYIKFKEMVRVNIWLILILTVLIMGVSFGLDTLKPKLFRSVAVLKSDQTSFQGLDELLKSLESKLRSGSPIFFDDFQKDNEEKVGVFDLNLDLNISFHDSLLLDSHNTDNFKLDKLNNDHSMNLEVITNSDNDSIGWKFLKYLNEQDLIVNLRRKSIENKKEMLEALSIQTAVIDTIIESMLEVEKANEIVLDENSNRFKMSNAVISDLVEQRGELIPMCVELENDLKHLNNQEIFTVVDFSSPTEIDNRSIFNLFSWVKAIFLSIIMVFAIRFFLGLFKTSE